MPKNAKSHGEFRFALCLLCTKKNKPQNLRKITDKNVHYERIKDLYVLNELKNYDPDNQKLPGSICTRCCEILRDVSELRLDKKYLPVPDFSNWEFPLLTGRSLQNQTGCTCTMCKIARQNCNQIGNIFGPSVSTHTQGRPVQNEHKVEQTSSTYCDICGQKTGRGLVHPKNCQPNLARNLEARLDQRAKDIITTNNYKTKVSELSKDSKSVQFCTQGRPLSIPITDAKKRTSRALFSDTQIPIEEFNKLKTDAKLSDSQIKDVGHYVRRWKGRNSIESNMSPVISLNTKSLKDYFTTDQKYMDSSLKDDKKIGSKVLRDIGYTNDFPGLVNHIKNVRGIVHPMTRNHLKLFIDSGRSSLKFSFTIGKQQHNPGGGGIYTAFISILLFIFLDKVQTDLASPVKSKRRTSYDEDANPNRNKNTGVNRYINCTII